jgi:transposase-like protein
VTEEATMKKSRRRSASDGSRLVERYQASGVTQREFAEREGVTMSALQYWLRKARAGDDGGEEAAERFQFVEVIGEEAEEAGAGGVSLELPGGLSLRFESLPSPSYLASVAAAFAEE